MVAKRMIIMLLVVGLVLGGVFGFQAFKARMIDKAMAALSNQPQTVSTTTAKLQQWQPTLNAVGTLRAVNGADLATEVAGIVDSISFESGEDVEAGTVLLQLRADDELGRLRSLQAAADLAELTYQRHSELLKTNAVSQATVDSDAANLRSTRAQVAEQQAVVAKKSLRAPFDGRLGIRKVDLGEYLAPGTNVVTLQALDPIYLDFLIPQRELAQLREGLAVSASVDTFPDTTFEGTISAINSRVDSDTRNIQIRATIANPDRRLLPGMFARVSIAVGAPQARLTLPQTAITYNPYGNTVYIVSETPGKDDAPVQHVAQQVFVTLGATRGDQVAVLKGLEPGATVVTNGQIKLQSGTPVTINNAVQPTADPNPTPTDE